MNVETKEIVQVIIQGGAVGLCVLLVGYIVWRDRLGARKDEMFTKALNDFSSIMTNHVEHLTEALNKTTIQLELMNSNHIHMKGALDSNAKVLNDNFKVLTKANVILEKIERNGKK